MKTLILLHGKKRVGKDTLTKMLKTQQPSIRTVALAAPMKQILATTFGITLGDLEDYKNEGFALLHGLPTNSDINGGDYQMQTYREIIQRFGTEASQSIFGVDVWIRQATKAIDQWFKSTDIVIVTDVRFDAELLMLKNQYATEDDVRIISVKINRDTPSDDHISELGLDDRMFNIVIDNTTTLEALELQVKTLLKGINGNK